jgi:hypothetical protein
MKVSIIRVVAALGVALALSAAPPGEAKQPKKEAKKNDAKQSEYSKVEVRGTVGRGMDSSFDRPSWAKLRYFTIKVGNEAEWRLLVAEADEKFLDKYVGKRVTITGSLAHQAIRVKSIDALDGK